MMEKRISNQQRHCEEAAGRRGDPAFFRQSLDCFVASLLAMTVLLCLLSTPARAGTGDTTTGLVGHWTLDETAGTTATDSAGGNDGTFDGNPVWRPTDGMVGGAIAFDGNDTINIGDFAALEPANITACAWAKRTGLGGANGWQTFLYKEDWDDAGYSMGFSPEATDVMWRVLNTNSAGTYNLYASVTTTEWHHYCGSFDGTTSRLYVDGVMRDSVAASFNPVTSNPFLIGDGSPVNNLEGYIDDVRIYNRALSDDDIMALYQRSDKYCDNPTAAPGVMQFNADRSALQYCDGDKWVMMGLGSYTPVAVNFSGADVYLSTASGMAGVTDSTKWSGSFWVYRTTDDANTDVIYDGKPNDLSIDINVNDRVQIIGADSAGTQNLSLSATTTPLSVNTWYHVLFSVDLNDPAKRHMYINDTLQSFIVGTYTVGSNIDFTQPNHGIGATTTGANDLFGNLADVWIDFGTYIDFSDPAMRAKFRSATGTPMYLGNDGSLPTGAAPDIFLSGDEPSWHTNKGAGGGFTENGALVYSSNQIPHTAAPDLTSGLVGYWKLDETTGATLSDSSATGLNATWTDGSGNSVAEENFPGKFNGSIKLDGTNDYIQMADNDAIDFASGEDFTVATWIKTAQAPVFDQWPIIAAKHDTAAPRNDWEILLHDSTTPGWVASVKVDGNTYGAYGRSDIADGQWHHIAFMREGDTVRTYEDGLLAAEWTVAGTGGDATNTGPMRMGRSGFGTPYEYWFGGSLDDVRIYNRALSAAEIQILAKGSCSGPAGAGGELIFNTDHKVMQYCNGRDWVAMSRIGGTGGSGCASPAGQPGHIRFDPVNEAMQYCNAENWVTIGKAAAPTSGLVGHWRLDETSGTSAADSTGLNAGSLLNGLSATTNDLAGTVGRALQFDGVDDKISIPSNAAYNSAQGTWAFWFKTGGTWQTDDADPGNSAALMARSDNNASILNGLQLMLATNGSIFAQAKDGVGTVCNDFYFGPSMPLDNSWRHYVAVYNQAGGGKVDLYLNGTKVYSCTNSGAWSFNGQVVILGDTLNSGYFEEYGGAMDDVRIYNRALSEAEIKQLYEATR